MAGHEPTIEQCQLAAKNAIDKSRLELEERGIGWDLLSRKLQEELNYSEPTLLREYQVVKTGKKTRRVVVSHRKIKLKTPAAMTIAQKARISAHELSGHFPPKETRIAGPGGGPLAVQGLSVEFVTPQQKGGEGKKKG